jgi:hypothetical protein
MGRPSKYDDKYCEELVSHMKLGFSLESFAGKIGVHKDTLYAWKHEHEEFSDAIKRGQAACQLIWEYRLIESVTNPKKINATSVYFALKCRFGYKETTALEHSGPDGKPIETKNLSQLPDGELDARIAALLSKGGGK